MKKLLILFSAASLCFVSCKNENKEVDEAENTIAAETTAIDDSEIIEEPMDSVAVQKAWDAYMTPSEAHKMLAAEEGKWNNEMTFWMGPDAPPEKATSTADIKMVMGGRYQESNYTGEMMGMPFEGLATVAYDNAAKEYVSTWIDNMGTGLMVMRGTYDEATKATTLTGSMVDPVSGKEKQYREVYTIVDDNTRKMEMYETAAGGEETKTMEIIMKRA